jgi:hypothetical protein
VVPCDLPHDAEMILSYLLPKGTWPGDQEMSRLSAEGCDQRFRTRFGTRMPVQDGVAFPFGPTRASWRLGDHRIHCAIGAIEGEKLRKPIGSGRVRTRTMDELRAGDCFDQQKEEPIIVTPIPCGRPHDAQLTHRFDLPKGGAYPGDAAVEKQATKGCDVRWKKAFGKNPPPVQLEPWLQYPFKEDWDLGKRLVVCWVTDGEERKLKRSFFPR